MIFDFEQGKYEIIFGSDIIHDGVYLELNVLDENDKKQLIFAFRSDSDRRITLYFFCNELPYTLLKRFMDEVDCLLLQNEEE